MFYSVANIGYNPNSSDQRQSSDSTVKIAAATHVPRQYAPSGCWSPANTHHSHHRWFYIIYTTEGKSTALSFRVPSGYHTMAALAQETRVNGCAAVPYNTAGMLSPTSECVVNTRLHIEKPWDQQLSSVMSAMLVKSVGNSPFGILTSEVPWIIHGNSLPPWRRCQQQQWTLCDLVMLLYNCIELRYLCDCTIHITSYQYCSPRLNY